MAFGPLRRMLAGSGGNPQLAVAVLDGLAQAAVLGPDAACLAWPAGHLT